jgi:hypothetical protein
MCTGTRVECQLKMQVDQETFLKKEKKIKFADLCQVNKIQYLQNGSNNKQQQYTKRRYHVISIPHH